MSSVSAYSSNQSYAIDLRRDGKHTYSSLDDDEESNDVDVAINMLARAADSGSAVANASTGGGGSIGATTSGSNTASAVSSSLSSRGITVTSTGLSSTDGFTSESTNARAALDFSGAPQLPESSTRTSSTSSSASATQITSAASTVASTSTLSRSSSSSLRSSTSSEGQGSDLKARLSDYVARTSDGDGGLMWDALSTMAKSAALDEKTAAEIKNAMQKGKVEAKKNEIQSTEEQIEAEREAAAMNLMFAVVSAVVQMALSFVPGAGAAVGAALAPVVKSLGEYINKTSGPQAEADQKKIETMRHQMMQEVYEQGIENAKSNYDEARELMKLAIKILTEHAERQTQITTTITRT